MEKRLPLIGEPAPEFKAQTTHGPLHFPADYKGKWVVFFSHPADFTPVCTTEFVSFAKRYGEFKALNAELVGLSVDHVYSHIKWVEWIEEKLKVEIPFPIVADTTGKIAELYGMIHPGASEAATVRAVFLLCPQGVVRTVLYYPLNIGRNIPEILRILRAFQASMKDGVAIPANWPENELIGGNVIVPPPSDLPGAQKRLQEAKEGKVECYDWWFCHRKGEGMIGKKMEEALNDQVKEELFSAYLYLSMAAYFSHEGWDGMASWMRIQAAEELGHALRIFDHVLERGGKVVLQALPVPEGAWASPLAAFQAAYKHEQHITGRIHALVELAQKEKDPAAGAMLQWFVTEQVEEEAQALRVVQLLERVGGDARGLVMADRELGQRKKED